MKTIRLSQLKEEFEKLPEGSMLSISLEPEKDETEDQKEEIKERKEGKKNEYCYIDRQTDERSADEKQREWSDGYRRIYPRC